MLNIKNTKKIVLLISSLGLTNLSLFAPIIHVNPNTGPNTIAISNPVIVDYTPPPPRNIVAFFDDGSEAPNQLLTINTYSTIQFYTNTGFIAEALRTEPRNPIFIPESLMFGVVAHQTIVEDFYNLSDNMLKNIYDQTPKFSSQGVRDSFKKLCIFFVDRNATLTTALKDYQQSPSIDGINSLNDLNKKLIQDGQNIYQSIDPKLFNDDNDLMSNFYYEIEYYANYYNAFKSNQWAIGKTDNGSYLLLPKDENGAIKEIGLNYDHINGLNGVPINNPFDVFKKNIDSLAALPAVNTTNMTSDFLDIIKISPTTAEPSSLNVYLAGHGSPKTTTSNGMIAGLDLDFFNKTIVTALDKADTKTMTVESCFLGDITAQSAFEGVHSFTAISGVTISSVELGNFNYKNFHNLINNEYKLSLSGNPVSTPEEFQQKINNTIFLHSYFESIDTSIANGVTNLFGAKDYTELNINNIPSIKLATTDNWVTINDFNKNTLEISTQKSRAASANSDKFIYDFKDKNTELLLSSETILTPIVIKAGSALPKIVPISIGEKIHYIENMIIEDPSITAEMFINQSLKPFINEVSTYNLNDKTTEKTIVIDLLYVQEGWISLIVTQNYAVYTMAQGEFDSNGERPKHYIRISDKFDPLWYNVQTHYDIINKARDQALKEKLVIENIEKVSTAVHDRQKTLLLIQKLITDVEWENYTKQNDLSSKNAMFNAIIEAIKQQNNTPLELSFLTRLSPDELKALSDALASTSYDGLTDDIKSALTQTLAASQEEYTHQQLKAVLADQIKISDRAVLDWYNTLSLQEQIIIKFDYNAALESFSDLTIDPNHLTNREKLLIENYLNETIILSFSPTKIADLKAKLTTITAPRDEALFTQYLQAKLHSLNATGNKQNFIDWVIALDSEEEKLIHTDIEAIFLSKRFNDIISSQYNLNITELMELKIILKKFLLSDDIEKNSILEKIYYYDGSTTIPFSSAEIQDYINSLFDFIDTKIEQAFHTISEKEQLMLINPNSVDTYAQIFKELPFATQTAIAQNLDLLKNALTTDLLDYQKSLLPERISHAATPADLDAIKADLTAAIKLSDPSSIYSPADMPADFQSTYNKLLAQQNQRIAEHTPSIPNAGSTGRIDFDPTIIGTNNLPIAPNTNPDNPNPVNQNDTPGQLIPDVNPDYKNKELEAEYEKEKEQEMAEEQEARAEEVANEAAQKEGITEKVIG